MKITTKKQLTVLLAALTMAAPQIGANFPTLQNTPLGAQTAEAQNYRRGSDYRDTDLNRMGWITLSGKVTSNPRDDYFEMRADNGQDFRVVTRANVSLRNIKRDDRIEVYGKRDGAILIAYSVKESGNSNSGNANDKYDSKYIRGTVTSNYQGDRFLIRINNKTYTVIAPNGEATSARAGREVEADGEWKNNVFHADRVRVLKESSNDNWNNNERSLQGTVTSDNDNRRFGLRLNDGRTVNIISDERTPVRLSRGDMVAVEGKWSNSGRWNNNNVFNASSVRIIRNNNSNNSERFLKGTVTSDNDNRRFSLRLDDGRTVNVVSDERTPVRLSRGDTVAVQGKWSNSGRWDNNNVFNASDVRVIRNNNSNNNERNLQGMVLNDNDMRRFTIRTKDNRDIMVVSNERNPRRLSRGDYVFVEGRWDWNQIGNTRDNVFRATSVRIIRSGGEYNNNNNNNAGDRVDFRGTIMRSSQNRSDWDYVVRSSGRDYLVRSKEKFRIGDNVRVRGVLQGGRITATDVDRI